MNSALILLCFITVLITVIQGENIGKCVGGEFCPDGFTCNTELLDCISNDTSTCVDDEDSDCASITYLCNNGIYNDLMTKTCPKTCGRCA